MMDGVEVTYNDTDDAMDAWNEHVLEVEQAADAVVTSEESALIIRASGTATPVAEATQFFNQSIVQLAEAVRRSDVDTIQYTRELSIQDLNSLQTYTAHRATLPDSNAHFISELADPNALAIISETPIALETVQHDLNFYSFAMDGTNFIAAYSIMPTLPSMQTSLALAQASTTVWSVAIVQLPVYPSSVVLTDSDEDETVDDTAVTSQPEPEGLIDLGFILDTSSDAAVPLTSFFTGESSSVFSLAPMTVQMENAALVTQTNSTAILGSTAADPAPPRTRGRPRKQSTPTVESQVRRSTRQNNDGILYALPNSTRRRSSSVPRATTPAVLQISEMQRIGVEECFIDPSELTEERLRQTTTPSD
jgi:hypothetical protein